MVMNIYPAQAVRRLIIKSKQTEVTSRAATLAATLEGFVVLNHENAAVSVKALDLSDDQRILVADSSGKIVFDNSKVSSIAGRYTFLPEIIGALDGNDVFKCSYTDAAFTSVAAIPVMKIGSVIGCVYIYDYDMEQAQFLDSTQANILRISVVISVIMIVFLFLFLQFFGKRVSTLIGGIREMSAGNYDSRIALRGQDELSEIACEFNELSDRLQKTEVLRREFVSNASHELRTPLASIKLLSDSILQTEGIKKASVDEFLLDINEEIDRLTRITDRLLQLTKLDFVPPSKIKACEIARICNKIVELLKETAATNNIRVECNVSKEIHILFDADGLYQVIFNLVENAIKYNKKGGSVQIWCEKPNEGNSFALFHVKDTGIGIQNEEQPHIFERFYRVDKARARETGGTGLGLAIVYDWLKTFGGEISVDSKQGIGTHFTVMLPIAESPKNEVGI